APLNFAHWSDDSGDVSPPPPPGADFWEHVQDLVVVTDTTGALTWRSPAAAARLGDASLMERVRPERRAALAEAGQTASREAGTVLRVHTELSGERPGEWRRCSVTVSNRAQGASVRYVVWTVHDLHTSAEDDADLVRQAMRDPLTSLANRTALLDRLGHATSDGPPGTARAVLYIDLDGFKAVNDALGHSGGDKLLRTVADRLRRAVRQGELVARLGGDEFVVVTDGVARAEDALMLAERIRTAIGRPQEVGGRIISVAASVGVAVGCGQLPEALLHQADTALYRAKQAGRNRTVLFDATMGGADVDRLQAEDLLRDALDHDGLAVLYQPVVELATGRHVGVEALLRLRVATGELLAPAAFLRVAEETGLIVSVGAGMLDLACEEAAKWSPSPNGDAPPLLSVNVSARQLEGRRMAARVAATLQHHRLEPGQLCLELAETVLIDAGPATRAALHEMRELGVHLAVDDFGTGPSSLTFLREYPIEMLKLDRMFAARLDRPGGTDVVAAVLALGRALRLTMVAKGVETVSQAQTLTALGCEQAQGFYFCEPVPAGELGGAGHHGAVMSSGSADSARPSDSSLRR
ncbi:MAG: putative bifunctional diguanylate cyclase/phosphodiesterase, partial [Acidimicrobiales bacterium]